MQCLTELELAAVQCRTDHPAHADLGHLFRQYRHVLVGFVMRYTGCRDEAEDVVQAAFLQALVRAGGSAQLSDAKLSGAALSGVALFGTALLLARERMRKQAPSPGAHAGNGLAAQHDPFELIALHQLTARLEASLQTFPQAVLDTFDLVVHGDTCHREAAAYLGIPLATVQAHMAHVGDLVRRLMPPHAMIRSAGP